MTQPQSDESIVETGPPTLGSDGIVRPPSPPLTRPHRQTALERAQIEVPTVHDRAPTSETNDEDDPYAAYPNITWGERQSLR